MRHQLQWKFQPPEDPHAMIANHRNSYRATTRRLNAPDIICFVESIADVLVCLPEHLHPKVRARLSAGNVNNNYRQKGAAMADVAVLTEAGTIALFRDYACDSSAPHIPGRDIDDSERDDLRALGWGARGGNWRPTPN